MPARISVVSIINRKYQNDDWSVFPYSYLPEDHLQITEINSLYNHLVFALKYEGVNLLLFSFLTKHYLVGELTEMVSLEPTGQYSRKIWFLIEWITGQALQVAADLNKKSYVLLLDTKIQYAVKGYKSTRHRIINNLPGTQLFCPLISKTPKLEAFIKADIRSQHADYLHGVNKDLLLRAAAFLMLKDSRASFNIEGEKPEGNRAALWGQAIGMAGLNDLSKTELLRLQKLVIENARFLQMGFRTKGGFVGMHDRLTGEPIPEHISARWQDLDLLITGLIETAEMIIHSDFEPVLAAASIAFGFVFIHPFEDGNGRIHRYLIHHVLAQTQFTKQGIIFPISYAMLGKIEAYRKVLESYSLPLLDFIKWRETPDHNVEVLNDSFDYYRYFDVTKQAEFLYECVQETIEKIIPAEVTYLGRYDEFKRFVDTRFEMPERMISLLLRFLEQNEGKLSRRAKEKEFSTLANEEIALIEDQYREIFARQ